MKNFEKFEKEIREIGFGAFGVKDGKPIHCDAIEGCLECDFNGNGCGAKLLNWLDAEYEEPAGIDWSKVPIDANIVITMPNGHKMRRHFAGLREDGKPCYYAFGLDSWADGDAPSLVVPKECTVEIVEE